MQYSIQSLNVDALVRQLRAIGATVQLGTQPGLPDAHGLHRRLVGHELPEDFVNFLRSSDGLRLVFSLPHGRPDKRSIPVGMFEVCGSKDLRVVHTRVRAAVDARGNGIVVGVSDGAVAAAATGGVSGVGGGASGDGAVTVKAVAFERVPDLGVVALVYRAGQAADPTVWLRDSTLQWHYICRTFSCYYRLAMVHMAVARWQGTFTLQGLDPVAQAWLAKLNLPQLLHDRSQLAQLEASRAAAVADLVRGTGAAATAASGDRAPGKAASEGTGGSATGLAEPAGGADAGGVDSSGGGRAGRGGGGAGGASGEVQDPQETLGLAWRTPPPRKLGGGGAGPQGLIDFQRIEDAVARGGKRQLRRHRPAV